MVGDNIMSRKASGGCGCWRLGFALLALKQNGGAYFIFPFVDIERGFAFPASIPPEVVA